LREPELIELLTRGLLRDPEGVLRGVGDDCAVLDAGGGRAWLVTVDQQVEGIHFLAGTTTPEDVGHKALAVSLSDIAAMGGRPRHAFLTLALPGERHREFAAGFRTGFAALAERFAVNLLGGDVARARDGSLATVTVIGEVEPGAVLYRSGAAVGERIYVTGRLGLAAAGLERLRAHGRPESLGPLERAQLRPEPRVEEGRFLAASGSVTACIDLSDGLAADLTRLAAASGLGARLEESLLSLDEALVAHCKGDAERAIAHALVGGEDYELCFSVRAGAEAQLERDFRRRFATALQAIGAMAPREEGVFRLRRDGSLAPLAGGFDHFAAEESA
jgi:thiamine-monophosphate kinase